MPRTQTIGQVLAQEKTARQRANSMGANIKKNLSKQTLFTGLTKTYKPYGDPEDPAVLKVPPQTTHVQFRVEPQALDALRDVLAPALDLTAAKEWGNQSARGDVEVGGKKLFADVPATYLLHLEHQLNELEGVLKEIPVLDSAEKWERAQETGIWRTAEPERTLREEPTEVPSVGHPGNEHHAPVVKWLPRRVPTGTYETVKFSGAVEPQRREELLLRLHGLKQAVHRAREQANQTPAPAQDIGTKLLEYLFA